MYHLLKKILPNFIKTNADDFINKQITAKRKEKEKAIPKINFEQKHIQNLQCLLNREELLKLLPKTAVVAEIGVDHGDFSEKILEFCQPQKLHLIDVWATERYHEGLQTIVEKKFNNQIKNGQIEINKGYSTEVVAQFDSNYFDWIYIDTDHTYQTTADELKKYAPKIKEGGIIAGHDFAIGNWITGFRYGVIEAVYEFCVKENWELIHLTMEIDNQSFAIRKI